MDAPVYTVRELTQWIKDLLETEIERVWVQGEISGYKEHASSGHAYFTLRDDYAVVPCVMWASTLRRQRVRPRNGMDVRAAGRLSVYEPRGQYQFYVDRVVLGGEGDLQAAFALLKERLESEGLFDPAAKKPVPRFPRRLGVVTSPSGAAFHDILQVLRRRWPLVDVVLSPAVVQGHEAADSIVRALRRLHRIHRQHPVDVIVLGRGGGSLEDLWAFNEEPVARAIHAATIPIVSAVGHEIDFTISDFVADLRAATPTAAAELLTPDRAQVAVRLQRAEQVTARALTRALESARVRLRHAGRSRVMRDPATLLRERRLDLDRLADGLRDALRGAADRRRHALGRLAGRWARFQPQVRLATLRSDLRSLRSSAREAVARDLRSRRNRLDVAGAKLGALDPGRVLERGYGIIRRQADGRVLREAAQARLGEELDVRLHRGALVCRVEEVAPETTRAPRPPGAKEEST